MATLLKNKRGLSPLIATILLIAFAVALGAVVMTIGKATVLGDTSIFSILTLDGTRQLCYYDAGERSVLEFSLKNGGESDLNDLHLSLVGTKDIINQDNIISQPVRKTELKKISVSYNGASLGSLKKVIITPVVIEDGQPNLGDGLEFDNIPLC